MKRDNGSRGLCTGNKMKPGELNHAMVQPTDAGDVMEELADVQFENVNKPYQENGSNRGATEAKAPGTRGDPQNNMAWRGRRGFQYVQPRQGAAFEVGQTECRDHPAFDGYGCASGVVARREPPDKNERGQDEQGAPEIKVVEGLHNLLMWERHELLCAHLASFALQIGSAGAQEQNRE